MDRIISVVFCTKLFPITTCCVTDRIHMLKYIVKDRYIWKRTPGGKVSKQDPKCCCLMQQYLELN